MSEGWLEWRTYRPSDFLLFSAPTYYRLYELLNAAWWPVAALSILLGGLWLALVLRRMPGHDTRLMRAGLLGLALLWCWVAWAFHLQRYAPVNWAAPWLAAGFVLQGLLLAGAALMGQPGIAPGRTVRAGLAVGLSALLLQPMVGPLFGRPWAQAELFGLAPDPTAAATLGVLLLLHPGRWWLWPLPLLWCAVSGATLWTMDAPDAPVLPALALLAVVAAAATRAPRPRPIP